MWCGQGRRKHHRVAEVILFLLRQRRGLGVLSTQQQRGALVGKFILWALQPGSHPLQLILHASIQRLLHKRWGLTDFSWVLVPCNTLPIDCSNIWLNLCRSWNYIKKNIMPATPTNMVELECILVWTPDVGLLVQTDLSCKMSVQQHLLHEGISSFRHVTNVDDHILD